MNKTIKPANGSETLWHMSRVFCLIIYYVNVKNLKVSGNSENKKRSELC